MNVMMTGTDVRFTRSKLEMFAMPATAIITALIGLNSRPTDAAFCMPNSIVTALPPSSLAKFGTNGAKANMDATPEPITTLSATIITDTITATISAVIAQLWIDVANSFTMPRDVRPNANVSPATMRVTVLAN